MKKLVYILLAFMLPLMIFTGCHVTVVEPAPAPPPVVYGPDGLPGLAFFGVDWSDDAPDFISTDNPAIPSYFRYGDYYQSGPGTFYFYYEGAFFDGPDFVEYFWEGYFDVWINPGEQGCACGTPGANGADSYLMMVTNPYGPFESRLNKTAPSDLPFTVLEQSDDRIVIETEWDIYKVKITYNKLEKSKKAEIPQDHVKFGSK